MSLLEIKNVKKNFGGVEVLKDISLKVHFCCPVSALSSDIRILCGT